MTHKLLTNTPVKATGFPWNPEKLLLTRDFIWTCPKSIVGIWTNKDKTLTIVNDKWFFKEGYIYNNCSMVPSGNTDNTPNLPVVSLNTNKVKILWKSALIHDKGYGCLDDKTFAFSRKDMDYFFYLEAQKTPFKFSRIYWLGVRLFGGFTLK